MSITPITWQDKIDNPELVAQLQAYSEQEYLTAEQINEIKDTINLLIEGAVDPEQILDFRQKLEKKETNIDGNGETTVPELLSASYRITSGFTNITGIILNIDFNYLGREYTFVNFQSTPVTIIHGAEASGVFHFDLLNAEDIVLTKGQMAKFKYCKRDGQSVLELVSKNFEMIEASTPTLTGVFDYTTTTSILPAGSPETIIKTVLIPANTFSNLDWLTLNVCMYDNVYLASLFNFYINSSTSLVGATKLMNLKVDSWGSQGYYAVNDNILLKDNKIIGLFQLTSISSGMIETVGYNSTIDLTVNNYIIITYKNSFDQGCNVNIESVILQKTN